MAPSESPESPPHAAVTPSASMVSNAIAAFDLICLSIRVLRVGLVGSGGRSGNGAAGAADDQARRRELDVGGGALVDQLEQAHRGGPPPADDVAGHRGERRAGGGQRARCPRSRSRTARQERRCRVRRRRQGPRSPSGRWRRRSRSAGRRGPAASGWRPTRPRRRSRPRRTGPSGRFAACRVAAHASRRDRPCTIWVGPDDVRDPGVPLGQEMLDRGDDPGAVVDTDGGPECLRQCRAHDHRGESQLCEQRRTWVVDVEVGDEDAVDPALVAEPAVALLLALVLGHDLEQQGVVVRGTARSPRPR